MPTPALTAVDINRVGRSWLTMNQSSMYDFCPKAIALGEFSGRKSTTYELPNKENFLMSDGLYDFRPGLSNSKERELKSSTITVYPKGRETFFLTRPLERPFPHAFADLEQSLVPGLLGAYKAGAEKNIVSQITTTYSSSVDWTHSGTKTLDDTSDHGNQNPLDDLGSQFDTLAKYRFPGTSAELWLDHKVASVLARHPAFTGHGVVVTSGQAFGSGKGAAIPLSALAQLLKQLLEIDEVRIFRTVKNNVREGQTASLQEISHGLCFGGVFDRRAAIFDIREDAAVDLVPDGCLAIAEERSPYVKNWASEADELEYYIGRGSFDVFVPDSNMGFRMTPTGDGGALSS